jgi:hypothetical protein
MMSLFETGLGVLPFLLFLLRCYHFCRIIMAVGFCFCVRHLDVNSMQSVPQAQKLCRRMFWKVACLCLGLASIHNGGVFGWTKHLHPPDRQNQVMKSLIDDDDELIDRAQAEIIQWVLLVRMLSLAVSSRGVVWDGQTKDPWFSPCHKILTINNNQQKTLEFEMLLFFWREAQAGLIGPAIDTVASYRTPTGLFYPTFL